MLQILIAEPHNIVRKGTRMLLELDQTISIVDEASNWQEAVEVIKARHQIDVVLSDIETPGEGGISILREIKKVNADTKVVILTMLDKDEYVAQAFKEGAAGYLLKSLTAEELIFALKHVHNGGKYLCAELTLRRINKMIQDTEKFKSGDISDLKLSTKEMIILKLTAEGLTSDEMARKLSVTKRSIEGYRKNLLLKTGVPNSAALIRFALQNGLVP